MRAVFMKIVIGLLLAGISLQLFLIENLNSTEDTSCHVDITFSLIHCSVSRRPIVMLPAKLGKTLALVKGVFARVGYEAQFIGNHGNTANWDVMWHLLYPFKDPGPVLQGISGMTSNQKINHYPGIGYIAAKSVFNTLNGGTKYTPKTFEMPKQKQQFLEEIKNKSGIDENRVWIQKNLEHRGNIVKPLKDLDLNQPGLIQEFIRNQFLLHGHVINIGINVVITSIFPLRAYILDNAWLIRICNKPFHPINYTDITTYVTDGDHMSRNLFDFPPMKRYFDVAYSRKQALLAHIRSELGKDPSKIEDQIYDAIQGALIKRQHRLKATPTGKPIGPDSSYFEVMRWDFILDDDLNIHLIEANMSPDMSEGEVLIRQKNEQLIYNTLCAIGYINGGGNHHGLRDRNTFVDLEICYATLCDGRCDLKDCQMCSSCLSKDIVDMLRGSYAEHINRQGLRAVYPQRMTQMNTRMDDARNNGFLSERDHINKAWLRAKCVEDIHWCT